MGILHGLERRLQGAVDKTFARIFGGSVQPAEVTAALQREAAGNLSLQAGYTVAPNAFVVELGPSDVAHVGEDVRRVSAALSGIVDGYVREHGWQTYAPIRVTLTESPRLHTGQFRVSSRIDPEVAAPVGATSYDDNYDAAPGAVRDPHYGGYPAAPSQPYPATQQPAWQQYPGQPHGQPPQDGQVVYPAQAPSGPAVAVGQPRANQPPPLESRPRLIVQDGSGRAQFLQRGSNVVGRGQTAALRLADTSVSREHVDVYFDGRVAIVHDLGSTNGTTVNGTAIQTWQLADGDVIRIGQSTVVFAAG